MMLQALICQVAFHSSLWGLGTVAPTTGAWDHESWTASTASP